jgi:hypothetical protein
MDWLTIFGLVAVGLMLVFYALKSHSSRYVLAFAESYALVSTHGFLQGARPIGLVEAIWSIVAPQRCWLIRAKLSVSG